MLSRPCWTRFGSLLRGSSGHCVDKVRATEAQLYESVFKMARMQCKVRNMLTLTLVITVLHVQYSECCNLKYICYIVFLLHVSDTYSQSEVGKDCYSGLLVPILLNSQTSLPFFRVGFVEMLYIHFTDDLMGFTHCSVTLAGVCCCFFHYVPCANNHV